MSIALQSHDRVDGKPLRRETTRWASLVGWLLAAVLASVSSVALATSDPLRGEVRDWIEFKPATGIGLPSNAWLRAPENGYADVDSASSTRPANGGDRDIDGARPECWKRSPRESTYVDIGSAALR
jgi:hypothetical protein